MHCFVLIWRRVLTTIFCLSFVKWWSFLAEITSSASQLLYQMMWNRYNFDVELVVREVNCFIPVFFDNHTTVSMNDVTHLIKIGDRMSDSTMSVSSYDASSCTMWIRHTFLQPYRSLHQLASFPTLVAVYKVLVTIAITSASADRAMNKVKLVKTRLRSSMTDEYFSSLMVIATEKDLADKLSSDKIINRLVLISPVLRKYLLWS